MILTDSRMDGCMHLCLEGGVDTQAADNGNELLHTLKSLGTALRDGDDDDDL